MSTTKQEAEKCATASAPTGCFGLIGILTIIEIVYYSFELWKNCHPSANTVKSELTSDTPPWMVRKARRSVIKSARRQGVDSTSFDVDTATTAMLNHVYHIDDNTLASCYVDDAPSDIASYID